MLLFVAEFTKVNSVEPSTLLNPPIIMNLLFFSRHSREARRKVVVVFGLVGRLISESFTT